MIKFPVLSYGLVGDFLFWYLITVIFHIFLAKNFLLYYLMVEGGGVSGGEGLYIIYSLKLRYCLSSRRTGHRGERTIVDLWYVMTSGHGDIDTERLHCSYSTEFRIISYIIQYRYKIQWWMFYVLTGIVIFRIYWFGLSKYKSFCSVGGVPAKPSYLVAYSNKILWGRKLTCQRYHLIVNSYVRDLVPPSPPSEIIKQN